MNSAHPTRLFALPLCNCDWRAVAGRKATWVRTNRLLAWALIVSPLAQVALRTNLVHGLLLDLAILVLHAGLSLWLFGLPRANQAPRLSRWLLVGVAGGAMSPRNDFLMSGWRVVVAVAWIAFAALCVVVQPVLGWVVWLPALWQWLALPFLVCMHIARATRLAFTRWGMKDAAGASILAAMLLAFFLVVSLINLVR